MNQETGPASTASLASALRAGRKRLHLSQEALADRAGVSTSAVRSWEAGRHSPRPDQLLKLADALRLPVREMAQHARDLTDLPSRLPDEAERVDIPISWRIPVVAEKRAASHVPAIETTADWLTHATDTAEDVPGGKPGDFAIRIDADTHGPEFSPGAMAVLVTDRKPQKGQTIAARLATQETLVFGVHAREGNTVTIQAHGRIHQVDLTACPGAIVWAFPVRMVLKRYLT